MPDDADIDALFAGLRAAKQERQAAPGGPQWERERLPALAEDRGLVRRVVAGLELEGEAVDDGSSRLFPGALGGRAVVARVYRAPLWRGRDGAPAPAGAIGTAEQREAALANLGLLDRLLAPVIGLELAGVAPVLSYHDGAGADPARVIVSARVDGSPWTRSTSLDAALAVARACAGLHAAGAVHGGLAPVRILTTAAGPVITEPGWAAFVAAADDPRAAGPDPRGWWFLAPEQMRGRYLPLDPALEEALGVASWAPGRASDVFALGCLLYEAVAEEHPFDMASYAFDPHVVGGEPEQRVVLGKYRRPHTYGDGLFPDALARALERALRPDPRERQPDAAALVRAVEAARTAPDELAGRERMETVARSQGPVEAPRDLVERVVRDPRPFLAGLRYREPELVRAFAAGGLWRAEGLDGPVALRLYAPAEPPAQYDIDMGRALDRCLRGVEGVRAEGVASVLATATVREGVRVIAERWVEGAPLTLEGPAARPDEAVGRFAALARALGSCHAAGAVHGGIRPSRLRVAPDGRLQLVGMGWGAFSVADLDYRLTGGYEGPGLRRFAYRAPEQVARVLPDPRSDVFSLAAVLFEALAGRPAFHGWGFDDLSDRIRLSPPDLTGAPPALVPVLRRALAGAPGERPADGAALAVELLAALG